MTVTIEDIAQHLNLAVSTVSKALNGYSDVSQKTKDRVQAAARDLDYHPNTAARNLRRRRTDKIGFLFSFPVTMISEWASRLITGAITAAEKEGYNLILYPLQDNQSDQLIRMCRAREVDGLLLMAGVNLETTVNKLEQEPIPYVVVGQRVEHPNASFITSDNIKAAVDITQHLISLGHKRIAYIARPALGTTNLDRTTGYKQALQNAGIPVDEDLIVSTTLDPHSGYHVMNQLLDLADPPTAVFAIHDLVAMDAMEAIQDRKLRIPQDIALVGFDNWRLSLTTTPPLTTGHPPLSEIGRRATEILIKRVADPVLPPIREALPVNLVIRQSTVG